MRFSTAAWMVMLGVSASCEKPSTGCAASNCASGCCDATGQCQSGSSDTECGSLGASCTACSGSERCHAGLCALVDAGLPDGGTAACDGCVLPDASCVPLNRTTVDHCAAGGVACTPCFPGDLCMAGRCLSNGSPNQVGDECVSDAHCQQYLGPNVICKRRTTSGDGGYPGGYCTYRCEAFACPVGSICVASLSASGEADSLCLDRCRPNDRCRNGYGCEPFDAGDACWLGPVAAAPADKIGDPCTDNASCSNPPTTGGLCLTNAYLSTWPGGYCTRVDCLSDAECSADGGAICVSSTAVRQSCVRGPHRLIRLSARRGARTRAPRGSRPAARATTAATTPSGMAVRATLSTGSARPEGGHFLAGGSEPGMALRVASRNAV